MRKRKECYKIAGFSGEALLVYYEIGQIKYLSKQVTSEI